MPDETRALTEAERPATPPGYILLTDAEYERLLIAAETDDTIIRCEVCKAWICIDDPAAANLDQFTGCWKAATHHPAHDHLCRSWRAPTDAGRRALARATGEGT